MDELFRNEAMIRKAMEHLLERHLDQVEPDGFDSLTEIVRARIKAERELAYWKQELRATQRVLTNGVDGSRNLTALYERRDQAERAIPELELEVARLRLKDEFKTLMQTWALHQDGIDRIQARLSEVESLMTAVDDRLFEVRKAVR